MSVCWMLWNFSISPYISVKFTIQMATPLRGFLVVFLTALRNIHPQDSKEEAEKEVILTNVGLSTTGLFFFFVCKWCKY